LDAVCEDTFSEAVLAVTNFGDDADTTANICGQVAGAYSVHSSIWVPWLEKLYMRDDIIKLAENLVGY